MFREIILPIFRSTRLCVTVCGIMHRRCCRPLAGNIVGSLYIRSTKDDQTLTRLACSKNRLAPVKRITLPRLELLAALVGTRLLHYFCTATGYDINQAILCLDATVALGWIRSDQNRWKTFVCNRVTEIHTRIPRSGDIAQVWTTLPNISHWDSLATKYNPWTSGGKDPHGLHDRRRIGHPKLCQRVIFFLKRKGSRAKS